MCCGESVSVGQKITGLVDWSCSGVLHHANNNDDVSF